jgi:hypothetical protein
MRALPSNLVQFVCDHLRNEKDVSVYCVDPSTVHDSISAQLAGKENVGDWNVSRVGHNLDWAKPYDKWDIVVYDFPDFHSEKTRDEIWKWFCRVARLYQDEASQFISCCGHYQLIDGRMRQ